MTERDSVSPEDVVQGQLDAYNAHDLEEFMKWWAPDAQYFEFPDTLLAANAAAIRERHAVRFQEVELFGKLNSRVVLGNRVVDYETVTRMFEDGVGQVEVVAIYDVENGLIRQAWFMFSAVNYEVSTA